MTTPTLAPYRFLPHYQGEGEGYTVWWEVWPASEVEIMGVIETAPEVLVAIGFTLERQVLPAVRQTQRSKWKDPKAQAYNESQAGFHKWVWGIMQEHGIPPFLKTDRLEFASSFGLPAKDAERRDLNNIEKALEDALQDRTREPDPLPGLYPNDRQIWKRAPGGKVSLGDGEEAWVKVTVRRLAT